MEQVWEVRWTLIAASEYEATINWLLENWNEKIAAKFRDDVWNKIQRLTKSPFIGRPSEQLTDCRQTLVLPYHVIIYKIFASHMEIVRVFDTRQNPSNIITPSKFD